MLPDTIQVNQLPAVSAILPDAELFILQNNGTEFLRVPRALFPQLFVDTVFRPVLVAANNTIDFSTEKIFGTDAAPITSGNFTFDFTNAKNCQQVVFVNAASAPTLPGTAKIASGTFVPGVVNVYTFYYISNLYVLTTISQPV